MAALPSPKPPQTITHPAAMNPFLVPHAIAAPMCASPLAVAPPPTVVAPPPAVAAPPPAVAAIDPTDDALVTWFRGMPPAPRPEPDAMEARYQGNALATMVQRMIPRQILSLKRVDFNAWDRLWMFRELHLKSKAERVALTVARRRELARVAARKKRRGINPPAKTKKATKTKKTKEPRRTLSALCEAAAMAPIHE